MPKILTVDDSKAIRLIVKKQVMGMGLEVDEAGDGVQGLEKLAGGTFDLVLLDVDMPNMDGPQMLREMRGREDKTPVMMLTSESKRTVVAEVMKLGISDYILKPFKPDEMINKINKILKLDLPGRGAAKAAARSDGADDDDAAADGDTLSTRIDILLVDDMANVGKKLRKLVPERLTMKMCTDDRSAIKAAKEHKFKLIIIDSEMPGINTVALMSQIRVLQQGANFVSLCLRTQKNAEEQARELGYDRVLLKPFKEIETVLGKYFDAADLVTVDDDLVTIAGHSGGDERVERYFSRAARKVSGELEQLAAACYDQVLIDITACPMSPERTPHFVKDLAKRTSAMGLDLFLVCGAAAMSLLGQFVDTATIKIFEDVDAARAAADE